MINSEVHNINTRHSSNLHLDLANLDVYQNGVYSSGIKIFNSLAFNFKICSDNPWTSSDALKNFLYINSFYSLDKYYNNNGK